MLAMVALLGEGACFFAGAKQNAGDSSDGSDGSDRSLGRGVVFV